MYIILICFLITSFIFLIFGKTFIGFFDKSNAINYSFFDNFFIGLCVTGTLVNIWSLFLPTNIILLILLLLISLLLVFKKAVAYKSYFLDLFEQLKHGKLLLLSLILISLFIVLLYASVTPRIYDTYLYHFNSIQWNEMYRVVPGLANFHDRFGFNSSIFTLSACFSFSAIYNQHLFIVNSLMFFVFVVWIFKKMVFKKGIIGAFLLIYIFYFFQQYGYDISSPGTDLLPNLIVGYILISLLVDGYPIKQKYLVFIVLPLFCITIKLSTFPVLLVSFVSIYSKGKKIIPFLKSLILFGLLFVLPWLIRNLILSGYLLYPMNAFDFFSFDWKVPMEKVTETRGWIYSWARIPFKYYEDVLKMPFKEWFPVWWNALSTKNHFFFVSAVISPIFLGIMTFLNWKKRSIYYLLLPFLLAYSCFMLSFFTAPDMRFSFGSILFLALFPLLILEKVNADFIKRFNPIVVVFAFYSLFLIGRDGYQLFCYDYVSIKNVSEYCYLPKDPSEVKHEKHIKYRTIQLKSNQGKKIKLHMPIVDYTQCYDKFPCSCFISPSLKLRGEGLQDGFKF